MMMTMKSKSNKKNVWRQAALSGERFNITCGSRILFGNFAIDGEELNISCEFGDYVLAFFTDKADAFVKEIETELIKQFGQIF